MAAATKNNVEFNDIQLATFVVGRFLFGIDVLNVQEVLRSQRMTRVPLAPPVIVGLINLRGQIVPAIDMRRRLFLELRHADEKPMNMVVRTDDGAVSLLVDDIGDVLELKSAAFEQTPSNVSSNVRDMIRGVYKLSDRLLFVLDTDRTVDIGWTVSGLRSGSPPIEAHP